MMTEWVIGIYGASDYRLVKWDGSTDTEIGSGWDHQPELEECIRALMDHHGTGGSPFSSRDGAVDAHLLSNEWPLSIRDMTLPDETLPWADR